MAKILSFGEKNPKVSKDSFFKTVWSSFNSLDRFIKFYIFYGLLVITVTPAIISSYLIFNPRAAGTNTQVGEAWSQAPSGGSSVSTSSLAQPAAMDCSSDYVVDQEIINFRDKINEYRVSQSTLTNPLSPLTTECKLTEIAKWMANDMANNNYFGHTDSMGRDPWVRMDQMGYPKTWRGENLIAGTDQASVALEAWKGSPGHNAVMLGANYKAIGIWRAYNLNSTSGWYWATEFGGEIVQAVNYIAPAVATTPTPTPGPLPLSPPTNLQAVCNSANTQGIFSWTGSTSGIAYSFNYTGPSGNLGWSPASNPTTINVIAGHNYIWKVKACSSSGPECSAYVTGPTLTCGTLDPNLDSDRDGFKNGIESFIRTDPLEKCLRTKTLGTPSTAWPPDFNGNNLVNGADVLSFNPHFGATATPRTANYNERWDLNRDGVINGADVLVLNNYFGKTCL